MDAVQLDGVRGEERGKKAGKCFMQCVYSTVSERNFQDKILSLEYLCFVFPLQMQVQAGLKYWPAKQQHALHSTFIIRAVKKLPAPQRPKRLCCDCGCLPQQSRAAGATGSFSPRRPSALCAPLTSDRGAGSRAWVAECSRWLLTSRLAVWFFPPV